jgi:hypothetical protein
MENITSIKHANKLSRELLGTSFCQHNYFSLLMSHNVVWKKVPEFSEDIAASIFKLE